MACIDYRFLPEARVLGALVKWLFKILTETSKEADCSTDGRITVSAAKMMVCTQLFDDSIPVDAVEETVRLVGGQGGFTEKALYMWCVLMFGDAPVKEMLHNLQDLGEASAVVWGMRFAEQAASLGPRRAVSTE